jgi:hypothetical protein
MKVMFIFIELENILAYYLNQLIFILTNKIDVEFSLVTYLQLTIFITVVNSSEMI